MAWLDYIDILEWIISCIANQLAPVKLLNCRISINLFIKTTFFLIWFFVSEQNSNSDQYIFTLVLWVVFDFQILLEAHYIMDNNQCSICKMAVRRTLVYKGIDTLQTIVFWIYTFFLQEEDSDPLFYIKIAVLILCSIDLVMNSFQFAKEIYFRKSASRRNQHIDFFDQGGFKLFCSSVILGSAFAFYMFASNLSYYYELEKKASESKEFQEDFQNISYFFKDSSQIIGMIGQSVIDLVCFALICVDSKNFFSNDFWKNCTLFMYGLVFGMLNLYFVIILGIIIIIFTIIFCCSCCLAANDHQKVQQEEQQTN